MMGSIYFFHAMLRCSRKSGYETCIKVTATYRIIHTNTANTTIISSSPGAIIKTVILKSVDLTLLSYYCVSQIAFIQKRKKRTTILLTNMLALLFPLLTVYIHIHDACLFRVFLEPLTFTGTCLKSGFHQRSL